MAATDEDTLVETAHAFMVASMKTKYSYQFTWLGRPIVQYPQDIIAVQELIFQVKPDVIVETGIAHGGSLVFSASILAMLEYAEAIETNSLLDPQKPKRKVLGVDIDIRAHNRTAIDAHPMRSRIDMIEGSSVANDIIKQVHDYVKNFSRVMIFLDSNHTHDHVLAELQAYATLVSPGSYCVVFDTIVEELPDTSFLDRPWGKGNNPKTAVCEFLKSHSEFEIDASIHDRLQITVARDGYLKRTR
jgi:cephalosporin hydroxylase